MGVDHEGALRRLREQRELGDAVPKDKLHRNPEWVREARRHELRKPLARVPIGAVFSMRLDIPNNVGGNTAGMAAVMVDGDVDDIPTARQTLVELLRVFMDLHLPLPK